MAAQQRTKLQIRWRALATTMLGGAVAAAFALPSSAEEVTRSRLENTQAEPQNWLLGYGNYQGHMFSQLDQINRETIGGLKVAFTLPLVSAAVGNPDLNLMNHGLVDEGFLYIDDGWGAIYKVDLHAGDKASIVWIADAAVSKDERNRSRGMAMWGNAIYHNLADGRVVAVDRDTGEFLWDEQIARVDHPKGSGTNIEKEGFTAAPLPIDGRILVAQSNGDDLTRGWLAAVDAATGEEIWRTYTVPGPGEPGHETWADETEVWRVGGAGLWTTGTYDPESGLTYWGTGNAQPMFDVEYRPGDNLYSVSILGIDAADGSVDWYHQYAPNEGWDYDEQGAHQIVEVDGQKLLAYWARNGFHYRLNATTGEFVDASQYVETVNWTAGIDAKTGLPVEYDPNLLVQTYIPETRMFRADAAEKVFCPTWLGGTRWQSRAYNPNTFISYTAAFDGCSVRPVAEARPLEAGGGLLDPDAPGGIRGALAGRHIDAGGLVAAVDVRTNEIIGRADFPYESQSGALATAGGLIFTAFVDGSVVALDDQTLEQLWYFNTGATTKAPLFTFAVDGKQYVAILAGGGRRGSGYASIWPEAANWVNGPAIYFFAL